MMDKDEKRKLKKRMEALKNKIKKEERENKKDEKVLARIEKKIDDHKDYHLTNK